MPKVPYPYELNGKLVTGNGSSIPICSLSNSTLLSSLTVLDHAYIIPFFQPLIFIDFNCEYGINIPRID